VSGGSGAKPRPRTGASQSLKKAVGDICPRCGEHVTSYYVKRVTTQYGVREYYYAIHVESSGGKKTRRQCYLGPKEYRHTRATHEAEVAEERPEYLGRTILVPLGLVEKDRVVRYINMLLEYVAEEAEDRSLMLRVLALLKTYEKRLEQKLYGRGQKEAGQA